MTDTENHLIMMGRFGAPHGVKGWIKIISYSDPETQIIEYSPWKIKINGAWQDFAFKESQMWSKKLVVLPDFATNRNDVEHLVNVEIAVPRACLASLDEGYYWADLVGSAVETMQGKPLGTVTSLMETGANDVMVCKKDDGTEHLVPFRQPEIVKSVDIHAKKIIVDWEEL